MRIVNALICKHVDVQSSLLYVLGGSPEWWTVPELPSNEEIALAIVAEVEPGEVGTEFMLAISCHRDRGDSVVPGAQEVGFRRDPSDPVDAPLYVPIAVSVSFRFNDVGSHRIRISHEGSVLSEIRFGVRVADAQ